MATAGSWNDLKGVKLSQNLLDILHNAFQFDTMTPVQAATIPLFLSRKDVVVEACTGSGKTLAFVIPILEILMKRQKEDPLKKYDIGAIVITPVRELAVQIFEVVKTFLDAFPNNNNNSETTSNFTTMLLTGGNDIQQDIENYRTNGATIIIATPGRLEYMLQYSDFHSHVKALEVLVLDEADRLLHMGFQVSLTSILSKLPKQRRTGLFSATLSSELNQLIRTGLRNPVKVTVKVEAKSGSNTENESVQRTPNKLQNFYVLCENDRKLDLLVKFLLQHTEEKIIVYFLTCACVDYFWKILTNLVELKSIKFMSLHGKVPPNKRLPLYKSFVECSKGVLLSTDVASRGLDIPHVHWILQYDAPQDPEVFIHRVGRTARIGNSGNALAFITPQEDAYIEYLKIKKVPIEEFPSDNTEAPNCLASAKKLSLNDREIMEKGQVAFVSYIRAYKEHQLTYIFRFNKLNLGKLATGFALLKLPKMPELRNAQNLEFVEERIDPSSIKYKDHNKEKQRQNSLENKKRKREEEQNQKHELKSKLEKQSYKESSDDSSDSDDTEDLAKEARLLKKLKTGKITEQQYEEALEDDSSGSDSESEDGLKPNGLTEQQRLKLSQIRQNKNVQKNRKKLLKRKAPKERKSKGKKRFK